jgi:hypothetical protein
MSSFLSDSSKALEFQGMMDDYLATNVDTKKEWDWGNIEFESDGDEGDGDENASEGGGENIVQSPSATLDPQCSKGVTGTPLRVQSQLKKPNVQTRFSIMPFQVFPYAFSIFGHLHLTSPSLCFERNRRIASERQPSAP